MLRECRDNFSGTGSPGVAGPAAHSIPTSLSLRSVCPARAVLGLRDEAAGKTDVQEVKITQQLLKPNQ